MPPLPPHDNRVLLAADALKKEIRCGRLSDALPGERELAQRLRVSRKTLRKAMALLEKDRWIGPAQHGKRRQVLIDPATFATSQNIKSILQGKSVITMAPRTLSEMGSTETLFQNRLNRICENAGITLKHRHLDVRHMKRPAYRLQEYVRQNPADTYLLQHSSRPIQNWFEKQTIPSLVLGDRWDELNLPSVDVDHEATAVHVSTLLHRHGHRRVVILLPDPAKRGLEIFAAKLQLVAPEIDFTVINYAETPESTRGAVARVLTECSPAPTAVLTPTIFSTVTLISMAGLRVPADLSIICLSYDELLQYTQPSIAGYNVSMETFAKSVFKSLSELLLHPRFIVTEPRHLVPDYMPGGSIGKAK